MLYKPLASKFHFCADIEVIMKTLLLWRMILLLAVVGLKTAAFWKQLQNTELIELAKLVIDTSILLYAHLCQSFCLDIVTTVLHSTAVGYQRKECGFTWVISDLSKLKYVVGEHIILLATSACIDLFRLEDKLIVHLQLFSWYRQQALLSKAYQTLQKRIS